MEWAAVQEGGARGELVDSVACWAAILAVCLAEEPAGLWGERSAEEEGGWAEG